MHEEDLMANWELATTECVLLLEQYNGRMKQTFVPIRFIWIV